MLFARLIAQGKEVFRKEGHVLQVPPLAPWPHAVVQAHRAARALRGKPHVPDSPTEGNVPCTTHESLGRLSIARSSKEARNIAQHSVGHERHHLGRAHVPRTHVKGEVHTRAVLAPLQPVHERPQLRQRRDRQLALHSPILPRHAYLQVKAGFAEQGNLKVHRGHARAHRRAAKRIERKVATRTKERLAPPVRGKLAIQGLIEDRQIGALHVNLPSQALTLPTCGTCQTHCFQHMGSAACRLPVALTPTARHPRQNMSSSQSRHFSMLPTSAYAFMAGLSSTS